MSRPQSFPIPQRTIKAGTEHQHYIVVQKHRDRCWTVAVYCDRIAIGTVHEFDTQREAIDRASNMRDEFWQAEIDRTKGFLDDGDNYRADSFEEDGAAYVGDYIEPEELLASWWFETRGMARPVQSGSDLATHVIDRAEHFARLGGKSDAEATTRPEALILSLVAGILIAAGERGLGNCSAAYNRIEDILATHGDAK